MADYSQSSTSTYRPTGQEGLTAQPWPQTRMDMAADRTDEGLGFSPTQSMAAPVQPQNAPQQGVPSQIWMQNPPTQTLHRTWVDAQTASERIPPPDWPGGLQISTGLTPEMTMQPQSLQENYQGSIKALLSRNLGFYVVASFLVGTQNTVSWEGILYSVGNDYLVLWQEDLNRFIVGNIYSLKFVELHNTRNNPECGMRQRG